MWALSQNARNNWYTLNTCVRQTDIVLSDLAAVAVQFAEQQLHEVQPTSLAHAARRVPLFTLIISIAEYENWIKNLREISSVLNVFIDNSTKIVWTTSRNAKEHTVA